MKYIFEQLQTKKSSIILIGTILIIGVFLRTYHFDKWLLFEIDQSYDTRIVSEAIENGIENLPLLGPTAGGGRALRLGPAFYYMEYISASLFGNVPEGHAMLILLSSLFALPLFFLLVRKYFSTSISLSLFAIFSFSSYLILYGRFSWSPNILPFFVILFLFTLLKSTQKDSSKNERWFLLFVATTTIASQIHFNAFFILPTVALLFLLYKRPHLKIRTLFLALGIIILIYSPMIISDISTNGENISFFLNKISKSGDLLKNFTRTLTVDAHYMASGTMLVNTGIDHISGSRIKGYGFQNDENILSRIIALILFFSSLLIVFFNIIKENNEERKDFLILIFLFISVTSAYFFSLLSSNFQIFPRFYLLIAPVSIILYGILLEKISTLHFGKLFVFVILFLIIISNGIRIFQHFSSLAHPFETTSIEREDIFPNNKRLTLTEQRTVTEYIASIKEQNTFPIYINTFHEYETVFWYHLGKKGITYAGPIDENNLYEEANYFLIKYRDGGTRGIEHFTVEAVRNFGVLRVYTLRPKPEYIHTKRQNENQRTILEQTQQIQELMKWKQIIDEN